MSKHSVKDSGVGNYKPVPFDPAKTLQQELKNPAFREAYKALEDEFAALDQLLATRKQSGLTQQDIADRMGVQQSAVARIESSLNHKTRTPSLAMLRKYAAACGKKLVIQLV